MGIYDIWQSIIVAKPLTNQSKSPAAGRANARPLLRRYS